MDELPAVSIRTEAADDGDAIAGVVERAFGSPAEARLVEAIRSSPEYLAGLALVAVADSDESAGEEVIGHVMISGCHVVSDDRTIEAVMLSPLAVEPDRHGHGIGSALVGDVCDRAAELGHPFVVLEGDPQYYSRFGFVPAATFGLQLPLPDWAPIEAAQVLVLDRDVRPPSGRVVYPASFGVLDESPTDD